MVGRSEPHTFRAADLVGGHVVLDLVNTVTARNADPIDWLDNYSQLLDWAALTGEFDRGVLAELAQLSAARPGEAALALNRIRELRETLHDVLAGAIGNEPARTSALSRFDGLWKDAVANARLTISDRHVRLESGVESSRLDYLNHALALAAFELLQTLPLERTRVCAGPRCGWLFIDRSKGGRRRWCDMATCGNAAKSRRHYQRKRNARGAVR